MRKRPKGSLTPQQIAVLRLTVQDKTSEEIAEAMCLTKRTVDFHKQRIIGRLGVRSMLGAVVWAMRNGVVT